MARGPQDQSLPLNSGLLTPRSVTVINQWPMASVTVIIRLTTLSFKGGVQLKLNASPAGSLDNKGQIGHAHNHPC